MARLQNRLTTPEVEWLRGGHVARTWAQLVARFHWPRTVRPSRAPCGATRRLVRLGQCSTRSPCTSDPTHKCRHGLPERSGARWSCGRTLAPACIHKHHASGSESCMAGSRPAESIAKFGANTFCPSARHDKPLPRARRAPQCRRPPRGTRWPRLRGRRSARRRWQAARVTHLLNRGNAPVTKNNEAWSSMHTRLWFSTSMRCRV